MNEKNAPPDRTEVKGLLTGAALYLGWQADMSIFYYSMNSMAIDLWPDRWVLCFSVAVEFLIPALTVALCVRILTWKTVREWVDSLVIGCLLMYLATHVALIVPSLRRVLLGTEELWVMDGLIFYVFARVFFFAVAVLIIMVAIQSRQKRKPARWWTETKEEAPWMTN